MKYKLYPMGLKRFGKFFYRLCQGVGKDNSVQLAEATCPGMLGCGQWHHMSVTYEEKIESRRMAAVVSYISWENVDKQMPRNMK